MSIVTPPVGTSQIPLTLGSRGDPLNTSHPCWHRAPRTTRCPTAESLVFYTNTTSHAAISSAWRRRDVLLTIVTRIGPGWRCTSLLS